MQILFSILIKFLFAFIQGVAKEILWNWPKLFGIEPSSPLGKAIFYIQLGILIFIIFSLVLNIG